MDKKIFSKYYRVFRNDTAVTEVSTNDFKPFKLDRQRDVKQGSLPVDVPCSFPYQTYSLPNREKMYYGYQNKAHAMEMAKRGALKHIGLLIEKAREDIAVLKQYRFDHYEDLNSTLLDATIRDLEKELNIK